MMSDKILLAHGSGGSLMRSLIKDVLLAKFGYPKSGELKDAAELDYRQRLSFTTDSFVVSPLRFPGGDIGKLAVCGTVNDLAMTGAVAQYISLAFIIEEGFRLAELEFIVSSIAKHSKKAGVKIVTGDIKVVEKGACDKIFINTSGIGSILRARELSIRRIAAQDKVIISGNIAQHGLAVLSKRKELPHEFNIRSDCAALGSLVMPAVEKFPDLKFMRDPTRGGVAAALNEIAEDSGFGIIIDQKSIPVLGKVRVACELLGIDPLYVANEGNAILIVAKKSAQGVLRLLKNNPLGRNAAIIGEITKQQPRKVVLNTVSGTQRIVDMLSQDPLPRIC